MKALLLFVAMIATQARAQHLPVTEVQGQKNIVITDSPPRILRSDCAIIIGPCDTCPTTIKDNLFWHVDYTSPWAMKNPSIMQDIKHYDTDIRQPGFDSKYNREQLYQRVKLYLDYRDKIKAYNYFKP